MVRVPRNGRRLRASGISVELGNSKPLPKGPLGSKPP